MKGFPLESILTLGFNMLIVIEKKGFPRQENQQLRKQEIWLIY